MRILTLLVCLFLVTPAWAGPFGTEMGDKPEKFSNLKNIEKYKEINVYSTANPPQKHASFDKYDLLFDDDAGLVIVLATTQDYRDDRYGHAAKSEYKMLKAQLTKKYGKPTCAEWLNVGSIWNQPQYFAVSINKNERQHLCVWSDDLSDDLEGVELEIKAINSSTTHVVLQYTYKNMEKVREKAKVADQGAL